jgi:hypothetical protein
MLVGVGSLAVPWGCSAKSGGSDFSCDELKPEVSALESTYGGAAQRSKTAAYVQASKDIVWASSTLENEVASACRRIGADLGLQDHEMPVEKGPGGAAAGICNAVNRRIDLIQRSQALRTWVTIAAPSCRANQNAWTRCASVCDTNRDPQCGLMCRVHADVHAECDEAQVRVRPARDGNVPPQILNTFQANLGTLVHAQMAIGERLSPDVAALNQVAALLTQQTSSGTAKECVGAAQEVSKDATRRIRTSTRAAADLVARIQGY